MKIEEKITNLYLDSLETEKNKLQALFKPNVDNNRVLLSLASLNISKFEYSCFVKKDNIKAKQALYLMGKCEENRFKYFKKSNPIIQRAFYLLLSDNKELINSFTDWEFNDQDYWIKQGALVIVIQEILKNNYQKAVELLHNFDKNHKKYPLKEKNSALLKAIINNDNMEVEELLNFFLLPENHKKVNDALMLSTKLFSLHATGFAKLAWLKDIEVNIEHPLLPMELLPIQPNESYFLEYDFLKPDYEPRETQKMKSDKKGLFGRLFKKVE